MKFVCFSSLVFLVNYFFIRSELSLRGKIIMQTSRLHRSVKRRMRGGGGGFNGYEGFVLHGISQIISVRTSGQGR